MHEKPSDDFLRNTSCKYDAFPKIWERRQRGKREKREKDKKNPLNVKKEQHVNLTQQSLFKSKNKTQISHEITQIIKAHVKTQKHHVNKMV